MTTRREDTAQDLAVLNRLLDGLTEDMPAGHRQRLQDHLITEVRLAQPGQPQPGQPQPGQIRRAAARRRAVGCRAGGTSPARRRAHRGSHRRHGARDHRPRRPGHPARQRGAVRLLARVADAAARQPAPSIRDSQYVYVETRTVYWGQRSRASPA